RASVCGPARVPDAVCAVERLQPDRFFQVAQFAFGAANVQMMRLIHDRDAGRVVTAILKFAQAINDDRHDLFIAHVTNDATHTKVFLRPLNFAPRCAQNFDARDEIKDGERAGDGERCAREILQQGDGEKDRTKHNADEAHCRQHRRAHRFSPGAVAASSTGSSVCSASGVCSSCNCFLTTAGTPATSVSGGTSLVTTAPAPVTEREPTRTGATSIVSEPIRTLSSMMVGCFCLPS